MNTSTNRPISRNAVFWLAAIALIMVVVAVLDPRPAYAASYLVDTTSDANLTACTAAADDCSLRGAMNNANANPGPHVISFDPAPDGGDANFPADLSDATGAIALGASLPPLTGPDVYTIDAGDAGVTIDGVTDALPCFTITGSNKTIVGIETITNCYTGVHISGVSNTIGGTNSAEGVCSGSTDEDSDGYVNDGCATSGANPEIGDKCNNSANDDSGDDALVNDGCPARSQGIVISGNASNGILISGAAEAGAECSNALDDDADASVNDGCPTNTGGGAESGVQCANALDDDADTWVNDGCPASAAAELPQDCPNAIDDDGDTFVNDGCPPVGGPTGPETGGQCSNTTDDDLDTFVNDGCPMVGTTASLNNIKGNFIGTNADGAAAVGNVTGVWVDRGAQTNSIGGSSAGERNVISGNTSSGVNITGLATNSNKMTGNYVGLNAAGTGAIANYLGVTVLLGAQNTVIGGSGAGEGNVISGSTAHGLSIQYAGSSASVKGNRIGTDAAGIVAVPNGNNGIYLVLLQAGTTIGGSTAGDRNIISGNGAEGIVISDSTGVSIQGNYIGLKAAGSGGLGNGLDGVKIELNSSGNTIGGTNAAESVCSGSVDEDADGYVNDGCPTSVFSEGGLAAGGYNANCSDADNDDPGEDSLVNDGCPARGSGNVISGNSSYGVKIEHVGATSNVVKGNIIGSNADANLEALGNGSGHVLVTNGAQNNTIGGSTTGDTNLITGVDHACVENNLDHGVAVTGALTTGNTIKGNMIGLDYTGGVEMNTCVGIYITAPSNTVGGTTPGERNIVAANALVQVRIDGSAATGNTVLGNLIGTSCCGQWGGGSGVDIMGGATGNTIGGSTASARNIISGSGENGVHITGSGTSSNTVSGNYIGTNVPGTGAIANAFFGVRIEGGATGNTIGGTTGTTPGGACTGACNLISGNSDSGVQIQSDANFVRGNYVGTNAAGTGDLGNTLRGIEVESSGNTIGGTTAAARNVVSGNGVRGIMLAGAISGNVVQGNYVGVGSNGVAEIGNGFQGIWLASGGSGETVGGTAAGAGNLIAFNGDQGIGATTNGHVIKGNTVHSNGLIGADTGIYLTGSGITVGGDTPGAGNTIHSNGGDGVWVPSGSNNSIRGNSIYNNGQLGIDIGTDGVTGTVPTITSTVYSSGSDLFSVSGGLGVLAVDSAVDVFATDTPDPSGRGEGRIYLGKIVPNASSYIVTSAGIPPYGYISVTATEPGFNTTEFSITFDADVDGDGLASSVDNCDVTYNSLQLDHDGDGIGDACDDVVRNRFTATQSSLTFEFSVPAGQAHPADIQVSAPWDHQPGTSIDVGAKVGEVDLSFVSATSGCGFGISALTLPLLNASTNTGSTQNSGFLTLDYNGNDVPEGVDKYPAFLNTLLDPGRRTGIDEDGDGLIDEDPTDGINNDSAHIDEDGVGTPPTPHARYFATNTIEFLQVVVFEEVPNSLYRYSIIIDDTLHPEFANQPFCGALELRLRLFDVSVTNTVATPDIPGGDTVLNTPPAGTKVFKWQTADLPDADGDGFENLLDNCASVANADQADTDADSIGNLCEPLSGPCFGVSSLDCDGDSSFNVRDNCPTIANSNQADSEVREPMPFGVTPAGDNIGNPCDSNPTLVDNLDEAAIRTYSDAICVIGAGTDVDGDGWCADGVIATVGVGTGPFGVGINVNTGRVYTGNQTSDDVSVIDGVSNTVIATVPVGDGARGVAVNEATNRAYVANVLSNNLSVIDTVLNTVITTVPVGSSPIGVGVNKATGLVYVANQNGNSVSVVNGATNTVIVTVPVGSTPQGIAVNPVTNRIYVTNQAGDNVSVIDGGTHTVVATLPAGDGPEGVTVNTYTNRVYVAHNFSNDVAVFDGVTGQEIDTDGNAGNGVNRIAVGSYPRWITVNTTSNRVYVSNMSGTSVSIIDAGTNSVTGTVSTGSTPIGIAANSTVGSIYVANFGANTVSVIAEGLDPNAANAAVTPERVGAFGSCTNGVDDDGTGGTDFADVHCADADGDRIPDAADTCPQAADPLQLDADGDSQGDACEDANLATISVTAGSNAANAELRGRLVEVAPQRLHRRDGIIQFIDPDWGVTAGSSVTNGAIRAAVNAMVTTAIDPTQCATTSCHSTSPCTMPAPIQPTR